MAGDAASVGPRWLSGLPAGASLVELIVVLGVVVTVGAMTTPLLASSVDAGRARQAAQYVAALCRQARIEAVASSAAVAVVFDRDGVRWRLRRCQDGNGNGVRRAEITRGRDACVSASVDLTELFSGVSIAVDASVPDPDGGAGSSDAVRFGASDLASFAPTGTASSGTVFVRSMGGAQYAVRVAGVTGRTRVLRFEPARRQWIEV